MSEEFTTKSRKKEFDKIFKEKIVPFFRTESFERYTNTSKRLFKNLENELSVFIFLEYKTFGGGFYDMSIVYFDAEMGNVYDDQYLAIAQIKLPIIQGANEDELNSSTNSWIKEIKSEVIPFIEEHSTHFSIAKSNQFYISKARINDITELLKRKSINSK